MSIPLQVDEVCNSQVLCKGYFVLLVFGMLSHYVLFKL